MSGALYVWRPPPWSYVNVRAVNDAKADAGRYALTLPLLPQRVVQLHVDLLSSWARDYLREHG